jgi:hypothetical protein
MGELESRPERRLSVRGRLRVGDAGRERALGVLKRALARGQLSTAEFEDRVGIVYAAIVRDDLKPALDDLEEYQAVRADPRMWRYWLD